MVELGKPIRDLAISGAAHQIAYRYEGGLSVVTWSGESVATVALDGRFAFLAWSRDGTRLAASSATESIAVYDARLGLVRELRVGGNVEARVSFTPDGHLVSAGWDGTVRLWDISSGDNRLLGRHDGPALGIAISSTGNFIASVGSDGAVLLHDLAAAKSRTLGRQSGALNRVAFSPDDRFIVSGGRDLAIGVWRVDGADYRFLRGHSDAITTLCISPDGQLTATASRDGTVRLWDLASGESATLENVGKEPIAAWFVSGGKRLLTTGGDGTVRVVELDMPGEPAPFRTWLDAMTTFTVE